MFDKWSDREYDRDMSTHLNPLHEALAVLDRVWGEAADATELSRDQLVAVNDALGVLERRTSAVHAEPSARERSRSWSVMVVLLRWAGRP